MVFVLKPNPDTITTLTRDKIESWTKISVKFKHSHADREARLQDLVMHIGFIVGTMTNYINAAKMQQEYSSSCIFLVCVSAPCLKKKTVHVLYKSLKRSCQNSAKVKPNLNFCFFIQFLLFNPSYDDAENILNSVKQQLFSYLVTLVCLTWKDFEYFLFNTRVLHTK